MKLHVMLTRSFVGGGGRGRGKREERSRFSIIFWFLFCFSSRDGVKMEKRWGGVGKAKVVDTQFTSLNGQVNTEESLP